MLPTRVHDPDDAIEQQRWRGDRSRDGTGLSSSQSNSLKACANGLPAIGSSRSALTKDRDGTSRARAFRAAQDRYPERPDACLR